MIFFNFWVGPGNHLEFFLVIWQLFQKLGLDRHEALHTPADGPQESNKKNPINSFQHGASLQGGRVIHTGGVKIPS